jgi:hypothetical protein
VFFSLFGSIVFGLEKEGGRTGFEILRNLFRIAKTVALIEGVRVGSLSEAVLLRDGATLVTD